MSRFVLIIATDRAGEKFVLLEKNKGPAHLVGKMSFPGGRDDQGENDLAVTAARELLEETGVTAAPADMVHLTTLEQPWGSLAVFTVACDISVARSMESEAVVTAAIDATVSAARGSQAELFVGDFLELFELARPRIDALRRAAAESVANPAARRPKP